MGPLPCFLSLQFTIMLSRTIGIADLKLPMGDLFLFYPLPFPSSSPNPFILDWLNCVSSSIFCYLYVARRRRMIAYCNPCPVTEEQGGPEFGQISYIDILEPFAQMSNKRKISHKLGCEIKQETLSAKPQACYGDISIAIGSLQFCRHGLIFKFRPLLVGKPSYLIHQCKKLEYIIF